MIYVNSDDGFVLFNEYNLTCWFLYGMIMELLIIGKHEI